MFQLFPSRHFEIAYWCSLAMILGVESTIGQIEGQIEDSRFKGLAFWLALYCSQPATMQPADMNSPAANCP